MQTKLSVGALTEQLQRILVCDLLEGSFGKVQRLQVVHQQGIEIVSPEYQLVLELGEKLLPKFSIPGDGSKT